MNDSAKNNKSGFTLLEVLAATTIFVMAIFAIVESQRSSQRNVAQSERMFHATLLAQKKMSEIELKYQALVNTDGVEKSFATEEGSFEAPWADFKWKMIFKESSVVLSPEVMEKYMVSMGIEEDDAKTQIEAQALVLTNVNKMIKENYGELMVEVSWDFLGSPYSIPLVTHLIPQTPKISLTTVIDR